jgi:hypothetical protein
MCGICVMTAAAGATGARTVLQHARLTWLTRRRLRIVTVSLFAIALGVSSVTFTGSATPRAGAAAHIQAR